MTHRVGISSILVTAVLALTVGAIVAFFAYPAVAQTNLVDSGACQITVVGQGEANAPPDVATAQIGVETEATTAREALDQNNRQTQEVLARLKELGIDEKDIQTSYFNVFPAYDQEGREVNRYRAANTVTVTLRDIERVGALLDQIVQSGANRVYGVSFGIEDLETLQGQARAEAVENAKARAIELARPFGASVGEVRAISDQVGAQIPLPVFEAGGKGSAAVPVQPGEQRVAANVQVTFALNQCARWSMEGT